jgi:hypothetical protein
MTYSIVACTLIGTDCAENTIPLVLFTGHCLVTADCCDSTILALSVYATIFFLNRTISNSDKMQPNYNYKGEKADGKATYGAFGDVVKHRIRSGAGGNSSAKACVMSFRVH